MKLAKSTIQLIAIVAIAIVALTTIFISKSRSSIEVSKGQIHKVETMVQLCTIDFLNEMPINDTIGNWELFAIQKQRGSVSFNLENLDIESEGDTVRILLPAEIVDINESTDKDSWRPIDSKDLRTLRSAHAPAEYWNDVKRNAMQRSIATLYRNGTIERARKEGAENLCTLMEKVYRKPVKVTDPTPKGAHYDEFK